MHPISTYRLQFQPDFGFDEATRILPYLKQLGISHVYASPYLQAAPGSTHGYDVVDHSQVNEELGGEVAFARFVEALRRNGLGQILDIVPNHMAIPGRQNAWWWDVLKHGVDSEYADYFDIDWEGVDARLHNKVLVPILGDHYANVLERGEIRLERTTNGEFVLRYFDHEFPVDEKSLEDLSIETGNDVAAIEADRDRLDALVRKQHYRLAYWRVATDELDYRRFFDINTLVALRMDRAVVFDAVHERVLEWLRSGVLDGVRIDHVDGLYDPAQYLRRLRDAVGDDKYVVVEKILESGERLPAAWPVSGTTGYDLLALVDGLFVEPEGEAALDGIVRSFVGEVGSFEEAVIAGKTFIVDRVLRSDVERLAILFGDLSETHRRVQDFTRAQFHAVVRAMLIAFPVYRTYCVAAEGRQTQVDVQVVEVARRLAREVDPDLDGDLLEFFCDVLLLRIVDDVAAELAMRFQQATGAVMAKGVEDTAFYRSIRLASLNEVGSDPARFGVRPDDFHAVCAEVQGLWPNTMVASTTHDTKRSEDTRYRLHVLSSFPDDWAAAIRRWRSMNEIYRRPTVGEPQSEDRSWPSRHDEYLLYQTIVGAFPLSSERAVAYMQKASKEAKLQTSWTEPNAAYDDALSAFVEGVLSNQEFVDDIADFVAKLEPMAHANSLAATTVKLTMPGVPDVYQGTELWTHTLVDPDNRQSVDFAMRQKLLDEVSTSSIDSIVGHPADVGLTKLFVMRSLLQLRKRCPERFDQRSHYSPLWSSGEQRANILAFERRDLLVVVSRLAASSGRWTDTSVRFPAGKWQDVFTGESFDGGDIDAQRIFAQLPVAVFCPVDSDGRGQA